MEQRLADGHYASVTGFWTRIDDEIGTMSAGTWPNSYTTYTNYSHCTSYGVKWRSGTVQGRVEQRLLCHYTFTMPKRDSIGKYETIQMANTARHTINAEVYTSRLKRTVGFGVTAAMGRTGLQLCPSGQFLYGAPVCVTRQRTMCPSPCASGKPV